MQLDQRLCDRQTETGALPPAGPRPVDLAEWRQRHLDFFLVHADAVVADADNHFAVRPDIGLDDDIAARRCELDGVAQKIGEHLPKLIGVSPNCTESLCHRRRPPRIGDVSFPQAGDGDGQTAVGREH